MNPPVQFNKSVEIYVHIPTEVFTLKKHVRNLIAVLVFYRVLIIVDVFSSICRKQLAWRKPYFSCAHACLYEQGNKNTPSLTDAECCESLWQGCPMLSLHYVHSALSKCDISLGHTGEWRKTLSPEFKLLSLFFYSINPASRSLFFTNIERSHGRLIIIFLIGENRRRTQCLHQFQLKIY